MKITITGPRSVGKTKILKLVAKKLGLKYYSSDEIGEKHMKKYGGLDKAIKTGKIEKFIKDNSYNLIREIYEKDNFVFDLSGGAVSSRKFSEASEKVRKTVKENSIVIGLLPSKKIRESVNFLFEREKERVHFKNLDKKELLMKTRGDYKKFSSLFEKLCDTIIYVKGKTPEEVADEIKRKIPSAGGWQISIEYFDNYVIKTPKTKKEITKKISNYLASKGKMDELNKRVKKMQEDWKNSLKILSEKNVPKILLGNIEVLPNNKIKQNRAKVIQNVIWELYEKKNEREIKNIIEKILNLIVELWKYGVHEKTGKVHYEMGLIGKRVVLLDIGEITDNKETAKKQIKKRYWEKSVKEYFPKEIASYFNKRAKRILTLKTLEENWEKDLR